MELYNINICIYSQTLPCAPKLKDATLCCDVAQVFFLNYVIYSIVEINIGYTTPVVYISLNRRVGIV